MVPKILYIASCGHSGSTLLDSMISAHPDAFSVGEIIFVHRYAHMLKKKDEVSRYGNECTCGAETIWECEFWQRVEEAMKADSGMSLKDLNFLETEDIGLYRDQNLAFFSAVSKISGASVIIDSSKAPQRLRKLIKTEAFDITTVHLLRTAKGMVYSHIRKNLTAKHFSLRRLALQFSKRTIEIRTLVRGRASELVRYHRYVEDPVPYLERIMPHVGLGYDPCQLEWASTEKHNMGGNHMRRNATSELRLDVSWKKGLTLPQKIAIDALALPGTLCAAIDG